VLAFFRGHYCLALEHFLSLKRFMTQESDEELRIASVLGIVEKISLDVSRALWDQHNKFGPAETFTSYDPDANVIDAITSNSFLQIPSPQDLFISDIQRQNPVELVVAGLAGPLTAAVILSGGHLELGPLKVTLPPIGHGIANLKKALLEPLSPNHYYRAKPKTFNQDSEAVQGRDHKGTRAQGAASSKKRGEDV
jgi:hypothetical protein